MTTNSDMRFNWHLVHFFALIPVIFSGKSLNFGKKVVKICQNLILFLLFIYLFCLSHQNIVQIQFGETQSNLKKKIKNNRSFLFYSKTLTYDSRRLFEISVSLSQKEQEDIRVKCYSKYLYRTKIMLVKYFRKLLKMYIYL